MSSHLRPVRHWCNEPFPLVDCTTQINPIYGSILILEVFAIWTIVVVLIPGCQMKLTTSLIFAALLILIGVPRFLLNNNADTIVACVEDTGTSTFAEAIENLDDRLTDSFALASAVTAPHP